MTNRRFAAPASRGPLEPRDAPSFSIAIAAYQAADTIGETLESALAQTVHPVDIAVCDDGSTDDIGAALAPYRDRIVVVRQENRGEAAAKNAAARQPPASSWPSSTPMTSITRNDSRRWASSPVLDPI